MAEYLTASAMEKRFPGVMAKSTWYALAAQGKVPHIRLGRKHVRFPVEEVSKWLESQLREPVTSEGENN